MWFWIDNNQILSERFFSNLLLKSWVKTIIHCVTDLPFITWSYRSVLNFKFLVPSFLRSMSSLMSIEQKLCKMKIFQLQFMSNSTNTTICIHERFEDKNSGISCSSCLALKFNLSNPGTTVLHSKKNGLRLQDMTSYMHIFSVNQTYGWWLRQWALNQVTWIQFPQGAETLCSSRPFCAEPVSKLTHTLLCWCTLYNCFFLQFRQLWSSTDRDLTLNINIRLLLFWSTWSRARDQDLATCADLAHGQWLSSGLKLFYSLRAKVPEKAWQLYFLELWKIMKKQ